jgi:glutaredoxin 3
MKAIVYTKAICPYCAMAKQYLSEQGIDYVEVGFDDDDERQSMYDELGLVGVQRTVPQVFIVESDGRPQRIGGYNDLLRSDLAMRAAVGDFNQEF